MTQIVPSSARAVGTLVTLWCMRFVLVGLLFGCASAPRVVSPELEEQPLWVVATVHARTPARLSLVDERGHPIETWTAEEPGPGGVRRLGGVSTRAMGRASLRLELAGGKTTRVPLDLRGDERAIVVDQRGEQVRVQVWVASSDARLSTGSEGLEIANHGTVPIHGVGFNGWFQAAWLFDYGDGAVVAEPNPRAYCGTGMFATPPLRPGSVVAAGDSPSAMDVGDRVGTHVVVPFFVDEPAIETGENGNVTWTVARLFVAELVL